MALALDRNGLIVLDRTACLERLRRRRIGSIALTEAALPVVVPAVYTLCGQDVVLTADATSLLGSRLPNAVVSLCVQDIPDDLSGGWSVTVTGLAAVPDQARLRALQWGGLPAWGHQDWPSVVVVLSTDRIGGREIPQHWTHRPARPGELPPSNGDQA
jgi:hypothetical protein